MIHNKSHSNKSDTKFPPLVAWVLRPIEKHYFQCTEETQRVIKNLSLILLFTVTICGAIFAASICKFALMGNYWWMFLVLPITSFFYYLIDKPIIFSIINSTWIKLLRVFIAIILGIFNSFLLDSFYFRSDIDAARNTEIRQKKRKNSLNLIKEIPI